MVVHGKKNYQGLVHISKDKFHVDKIIQECQDCFLRALQNKTLRK